MRNYLTTTIIYLCLALCYSCRNTYQPLPTTQDSTIIPNTTILQLIPLAISTPQPINGKLTLSGTVTSNDKQGNFYKELFIQDHSAALRLNLGLYDINCLYPPSCQVAIQLQGLSLWSENGILNIGIQGLPINTWTVTQTLLLRQPLADTIRNPPVQAQEFYINHLKDSLLGQLITVRHLQFSQYGSYEDQHPLTDPYNNSITLQCSKYADFAALSTPQYIVAATGILMKNKKGYALKISSHSALVPEL